MVHVLGGKCATESDFVPICIVEIGHQTYANVRMDRLKPALDSGLTETAASREALIPEGNGDHATRAGEQIGHAMSESYFDSRGRRALVRQVMKLCLPREKAVELTGLGTLILRPAAHATDAGWLSRIRGSCEEAMIESAGASALLLVEGGFALGAVNAILGHETSMAGRSLSRIERGILHGLLATLSARLGLLSTVRVCPKNGQTDIAESIVIEISLEVLRASGRAWLCATDEFLARILTTQTTSPSRSSVAVYLELGRTRVPVSELDQMREGDAVVFDGVAALVAADPWSVHIRCGDRVRPASLCPDGVLVVEDADDDCGVSTKVERRARVFPAPPDAAAAGPGGEITAEIARLDGDALAGLLAGAPVGSCRGQSVLLRLADTPWAEGEMLAVDGEFAVRITRKLAG